MHRGHAAAGRGRRRGAATGLRRVTVAGAVAGTFASAGLGLLTASGASAATRLGGVDMQRACDTQWQGYGLAAHVNGPNNAFSWRCWAPWDHTTYGIDVNRACAAQYGQGAYSGLGSRTNPTAGSASGDPAGQGR